MLFILQSTQWLHKIYPCMYNSLKHNKPFTVWRDATLCVALVFTFRYKTPHFVEFNCFCWSLYILKQTITIKQTFDDSCFSTDRFTSNILISNKPCYTKRALRVILIKCLFSYFLSVHHLKINLWKFKLSRIAVQISFLRGCEHGCIIICSKCHIIIFA